MLGNILKLVRISNDMTVITVSKGIGLMSSLINDIECGNAKISLSTLEMFSEFYNIPISRILLLNDFQEYFKVSDSKILEDIRNYRYSEYQNKDKQKVK